MGYLCVDNSPPKRFPPTAASSLERLGKSSLPNVEVLLAGALRQAASDHGRVLLRSSRATLMRVDSPIYKSPTGVRSWAWEIHSLATNIQA
jgi:hypothetical protein